MTPPKDAGTSVLPTATRVAVAVRKMLAMLGIRFLDR